jgi:gas vesicle protein
MTRFTKEQAIKALEAKVPTKDKELDLGRTISEAVDNSLELIGEDSEMELEDFVAKVFKQVKTSIGLTHSENSKVAQKMQSQLEELQKKIDEKSGQKKDDDDGGDSGNESKEIKAMMEKIAKMEEKLAAKETADTVAEKRKQLIAKMSEDIKDNEWIEDYLAEINVTADTDVEAKAKDYVAFYNKTHTKGGKVTPKSTDGGEDSDTKYVKNTVAEAAKIKKSLSATAGGSPVRSTTTNNNN